MNDKAREALEMAAAELDRVVSSVETQADLWRQAAEHLRRGEINSHYLRRMETLRLLKGMSTELVDQLVKSVETRDPELWRREKEARDKTRVDDPTSLRTLIALHMATCQHGPRCPVVRELERLIGGD